MSPIHEFGHFGHGASFVTTGLTAWETVLVDCCTALLTERGVATMWMGLLRTVAEQCRSEQIVSAVATGLTAWKTVRLDSSGREYRGIGSPNQCDMPQSHSGDRSGSFECESAFARSKITEFL